MKLKDSKKSTGSNLIFDNLPPKSNEAEMAVLGSMIMDNNCIDTVAGRLTGNFFYRSAHAKIFTSILEIHQQGEPVDLITLS